MKIDIESCQDIELLRREALRLQRVCEVGEDILVIIDKFIHGINNITGDNSAIKSVTFSKKALDISTYQIATNGIAFRKLRPEEEGFRSALTYRDITLTEEVNSECPLIDLGLQMRNGEEYYVSMWKGRELLTLAQKAKKSGYSESAFRYISDKSQMTESEIKELHEWMANV